MKILSIDGGGSKGIIPFTFLKYINSNIQKKQKTVLNKKCVQDYFDYFTGSSVGVIIICLLLTPDFDLNNFSFDDFYELTSEIFSSSYFYKLYSLFGLINAKYDNNIKYESLKKYFKNYKIKDLKKQIIIPLYDLYSNNCYFITNETHPEMLIIDLVMSATAAPLFFEPWSVKYDNNVYLFVDNGIMTNNPCNLIISYLIKKKSIENKLIENKLIENSINDKISIKENIAFKKCDIHVDLDIFLVSLGTGYFAYNYKSNHWGLATWMSKIIDLFVCCDAKSELYELDCLLNKDYYRLNIEIPDVKLTRLDISEKKDLIILKNTTNKYIKENKKIFIELIKKLIN